MNISAPFIKRPVATSLLSMGLFLFGALAYPFLPLATLPEVTYPVIMVSANLPGASPETMATAVATPLERMFGRIAGITQMTSNSQLGSTFIVLVFELSRDIDGAARDVQAAINAARGQLPANLPNNPNWRKVNPAESPVMVLALTSETATQQQMFDVADSILAQKIAQIDGIGQVNVGGSSQPAVRVEINPMLLSKLGVGLDSAIHPNQRFAGPHDHDSCFRPRYRSDPHYLGHSGHFCRLFLSPQYLGHVHSQHRRASLIGGHLRGHVFGRLFHR